jgi:hypothetical protein
MAAIGKKVQFRYAGNNSGPKRIQMDVANQFEEIGVLLAQDRFISVLKKVPGTLVASVVIDCIPGEKSLHYLPYGRQTGL